MNVRFPRDHRTAKHTEVAASPITVSREQVVWFAAGFQADPYAQQSGRCREKAEFARCRLAAILVRESSLRGVAF